MQKCKLLLCPVAFALEINGIKFGIATSTRIPDDHKDNQQLSQRERPQRLPPKSVSIQDIHNSHVIFIKHSNEL